MYTCGHNRHLCPQSLYTYLCPYIPTCIYTSEYDFTYTHVIYTQLPPPSMDTHTKHIYLPIHLCPYHAYIPIPQPYTYTPTIYLYPNHLPIPQPYIYLYPNHIYTYTPTIYIPIPQPYTYTPTIYLWPVRSATAAQRCACPPLPYSKDWPPKARW